MSDCRIIVHSKKDSRSKSDFYPTPENVVVALIDFLSLDTELTIWEPACGDGAISKALISYGFNVHSSDIRFTGYGDGGIDFLSSSFDADVILTNPPFSLAAEFINHALGQADIVCMLLKSQYWHAKTRTGLFKSNPPRYVLPLNWRPQFGAGGSPTMDVAWTVWDKSDTDTKYRILEKPA